MIVKVLTVLRYITGLLVLLTLPAYGQSAPIYAEAGSNLGLIKHTTLSVIDQVSDQCWTNSSTIKSSVRLGMEQNDIAYIDFEPAFYTPSLVATTVSAIGFRSGQACAVSATFSVDTWINERLGGYGNKDEYSFSYSAKIFERSGIFTNASNVNDQLRDFYDGAHSEFLARVIAARRSLTVSSFHEAYPFFGANPKSREEWDEYVAELMEESAD